MPNLELAYVGDPIVSDLSPVYSKFADVSGDGLGDLVVLEKFTDSSGNIIPRIRYFQGILSNDIFAPAQQLNANINHDDFHFDRFELADLDQDFDLDLILPLKNREPGLSGKIVWYENLGDAQFSSEKLIQIALLFISGGAIGNAIDRVYFGGVIDFIDFFLYNFHWPAFNLADIFISLGVIVLLFENLFGKLINE